MNYLEEIRNKAVKKKTYPYCGDYSMYSQKTQDLLNYCCARGYKVPDNLSALNTFINAMAAISPINTFWMGLAPGADMNFRRVNILRPYDLEEANLFGNFIINTAGNVENVEGSWISLKLSPTMFESNPSTGVSGIAVIKTKTTNGMLLSNYYSAISSGSLGRDGLNGQVRTDAGAIYEGSGLFAIRRLSDTASSHFHRYSWLLGAGSFVSSSTNSPINLSSSFYTIFKDSSYHNLTNEPVVSGQDYGLVVFFNTAWSNAQMSAVRTAFRNYCTALGIAQQT